MVENTSQTFETAGDDTLDGNAGVDSLSGASGSDQITTGVGTDIISTGGPISHPTTHWFSVSYRGAGHGVTWRDLPASP